MKFEVRSSALLLQSDHSLEPFHLTLKVTGKYFFFHAAAAVFGGRGGRAARQPRMGKG